MEVRAAIRHTFDAIWLLRPGPARPGPAADEAGFTQE
jgi:hypothetical protein